MKLYTKEIDGKVVIKPANKIAVKTDISFTEEIKTMGSDGTTRTEIVERTQESRVYNPTHEQILADGWEEYVTPEPTAEELLAQAKANKIREIEAYDTSSAVNSFFYGNVEFWLDRDTRVSVRSTAEIMKEMSRETMTLWLGDVNVTLSPTEVLQMLAVLEVYALECYNTTAEHKAKVNVLATIEEVEAYDYRTGYPEIVRF